MSNREIKFRAWIERDGLMYYQNDQYLQSFLRRANQLFNPFCSGHDSYGQPPLMQYTGLRDKDEIEIYEGDILRVVGPWEDENNTKIIVVEFSDEGGYIIEWQNGFLGGEADLTLLGWARNEDYILEVIGNIWENPNLLMK